MICISNCDLKPEITDGLLDTVARYDVELIDLKDIEKQSGRPNVNGMERIAEQVLGYLNVCC